MSKSPNTIVNHCIRILYQTRFPTVVETFAEGEICKARKYSLERVVCCICMKGLSERPYARQQNQKRQVTKKKTVRPKFVETIAHRVMGKRQVNDQTKADFVFCV